MTDSLTGIQIILGRLDLLGEQIAQMENGKVPRYLSIKSVARMLDLKENAVRQLIHRRALPSLQLGRRRLVLLDDLQKMLVRYPSKDEILAQY